MEIRLAGVVGDSIVDGPGLRYTIFVQGCPHKCEGCHNVHTHDYSGGYIYDTDKLFEDIAKNPLTQGVTFSGGEPFSQALPLSKLGEKLQASGYNIMTYTGYTFEQLISLANEENAFMELLKITDILVDGRFVLAQRNLLLKFKGSENQRTLDCKASLESGKAIEKEI